MKYRKQIIRGLAALGALVLLFAAAVFGPQIYYQWVWNTGHDPMPPLAAEQGEEWTAPDLPAEAAERARNAALQYRADNSMPAVSAAIGREGALLWAGAYGWADIAAERTANLNSRFRLGSVGKPVTGVLLMRLAEKGAIALDAPIATLLQGLPARIGPLTARQLASHTAGVRHYAQPLFPPYEGISRTHYASVEEGLSVFIGDDLLFSPGSDFSYSSYGYSLLSRVLEASGGGEFESLLEAEVFGPAGMTGAALDRRNAAMPDRVAFYQTSDGKYTDGYPIDNSVRYAGGGMVGTPTDLVRLGMLLLQGELLGGDARTTMWTPIKLADGSDNPQNYALGWRIDTSTRLLGEDRPVRIIHHGGSQVGTAVFFMLLPDEGIAVAAMANTGTLDARIGVQDLTYALVRAVLGEPEVPAAGQ